MTSYLTTDRAALVTALSGLGVKVYGVAPATPIAPCLVVTSGSPWLITERLSKGVLATWRVMATVRDGADYMAALEDLVVDVIGAVPAGYEVTQVGPPSSLDIGAQGSVMACDITITAHLTP